MKYLEQNLDFWKRQYELYRKIKNPNPREKFVLDFAKKKLAHLGLQKLK